MLFGAFSLRRTFKTVQAILTRCSFLTRKMAIFEVILFNGEEFCPSVSRSDTVNIF